MHRSTIAPSILSADFARLADALAVMEEAEVERVHLDVMDGGFVPEITFGAKVVEDLRSRSSLPFDVHLMVAQPGRHVARFVDAGADCVTFHVEACIHAHRVVESIKTAGAGAGVAIVPSTPAAALTPLAPDLDHALVMTVNPGYGGQRLIAGCLGKITELSEVRKAGGHVYSIGADGGLNRDTAAFAAGADIVVVGSAIWEDPDPVAAIREIRRRLAAARAARVSV